MDRIGVRDLDLEVNASPKRAIERGDIPSALVLLFQHQLSLPEFEVGEWRVVSLKSKRKAGNCVKAKRDFNLLNREFRYKSVPVRFFKHVRESSAIFAA